MSNTHSHATARHAFPFYLALALALCALVPLTVWAQKGGGPSKGQAEREAVVYSCPMHSDVKGRAAGRCPKCGMDLRAVSEAGEGNPHGSHAVGPPETASRVGMNIPDVELLDQDGRKVHFYTDLVKGRVVAVNFIFTTCTTICPPLGATFARVQKELGERAGRDVHFISVSVDPVTDTPERMKAWGAKFHAGPGWTLVTGDKPAIDSLLKALAASAARREDHSPFVIVGNDALGQWSRAYGLAAPSQLLRIIDAASEGRLEPNSKEPTKK